MTEAHRTDFKVIGARIRKARLAAGINSLERFADQIQNIVGWRPSGAKISRVETGEQPVPLDIIDAVAGLTGLPQSELRPDLAQQAKRFVRAAE